jgi:hypothetical protein
MLIDKARITGALLLVAVVGATQSRIGASEINNLPRGTRSRATERDSFSVARNTPI